MRDLRFFSGVALAALSGTLACNSLDEKAPDGPILHIPTDDRPAVRADVAPVPVSGGTLHVVGDASGALAIVADEDRDLVSVVDLSERRVTQTLELDRGDRPGRIVDGADGIVHVVLRGSGDVLSFDPAAGEIAARVRACRAPRGIAFDADTGGVHVACAEGRLVTLDPATGEVRRDLTLDADLRDVLVRGDGLWVTRLKSAELLRLDAVGTVAARTRMPSAMVGFTEAAPVDSGSGGPPPEPARREVQMSPTVAWRAIAASDGGAVIVHQEAADDEIELSEPSPSGSAYGGGADFGGCAGIVRSAVSVVSSGGSVVRRDIVAGTLLPVDVAQSPDGAWIAIASAGVRDLEAPRPQVVFPSDTTAGLSSAPDIAFMGVGGVSLLRTANLASPDADDPCVFTERDGMVGEPVVAVAFASERLLLAQTREPARLLIRDLSDDSLSSIDLPGESRLDTGHDIFHRDSGGGIACASCHPEGAEDGHVWRFSGVGARRSQALHVGLEGTAPFHWDGDLRDVGALLDEVFVGRMGGVKQSGERLDVLQDWLFSMDPPPAMRDPGDPMVQRGESLFHGSAACSGCHVGPSLTNNESHAVGTLPGGGTLQVPSLVGIGYRAPFMHDGCARTLLDRFDPACGGDAHGDTSSLTDGDRKALVAYLQSL